MAKKNMKIPELSKLAGLEEKSISGLIAGDMRGIRFSTLYKLCKILDCKPNDILEPVSEDEFQDLYGKRSPNDDDDE